MHQTITEHRVPFHDIDILSIVWHGHYLKYFELARTTFVQSLGLDWPVVKELGFAMPVVQAHVEYRAPSFYDELLQIKASCENLMLAYMLIKYEVFGSDNVLRAWGSTKQVYMALNPPSLSFRIPAPIELHLNARWGETNAQIL